MLDVYYIFGDTETAGLGVEQKACEIALDLVDGNTLETIQRWESLVDPEIPINPEATKIHGITNEMVRTAPTSEEFVGHVLGKKFDKPICLIGHNIAFDLPMLKMIGDITHTICTLELSRAYVKPGTKIGKELVQPPDGPENFKLQTLAQWFNIPAEGDAHRAMADVQTAKRLMKILIDISERTIEHHALTEARVIHIMPFGKHAGQRIMDLPMSYIRWLLDKDIDANLRKSLETAKLLRG